MAISSRTRTPSCRLIRPFRAGLKETTTRVLASLTPREERVLRMRFGIGMNTDHTLEEVGQQFSVTRERIRQIEAKALRKLKHPSRSRKLRSVPGSVGRCRCCRNSSEVVVASRRRSPRSTRAFASLPTPSRKAESTVSAARIEMDAGDEVLTHTLIRADMLDSHEAAAEASVAKARAGDRRAGRTPVPLTRLRGFGGLATMGRAGRRTVANRPRHAPNVARNPGTAVFCRNPLTL